MSRSVRDIMTCNVITISPDALLGDAYALFRSEKISMLVVAQQGRAVGLLTERDVVHFIHDNLDFTHTTVASVMSTPVTTVQMGLSLFDAYSVLTEKHFRHLVIVDDNGLLAGVVTLTDMLDGMGLEYFVDLKQVASIMSTKITQVRPNDSLRLVIDLMYRYRISCVIVTEQWKPVGIITERDIVKYYDQGMQVDDIEVSLVMSSPVRTISDCTFIPEVNRVMHDERLRHMVIVDHQGRLSGLISQTDLTACMEAGYISNFKGVIEHREKKLSQINRAHDITEQKLAERQLVQSEPRFQALVEMSQAMLWVLDFSTGCFSYMGEQVELQLGYPIESWINIATWAARIHSEDREKTLRYCAEATERGEDHQLTCRMIAADGREVLVQTYISVLIQAGRAVELRGFMLVSDRQHDIEHSA